MAQCGHCSAKSQLYLCGRCTHDLHDMLTGLPRWLEFLHDAAIGNTRLGESVRRSNDTTTPMPCNLSASELYDDAHQMLARWCEQISITTETLTGEGSECG